MKPPWQTLKNLWLHGQSQPHPKYPCHNQVFALIQSCVRAESHTRHRHKTEDHQRQSAKHRRRHIHCPTTGNSPSSASFTTMTAPTRRLATPVIWITPLFRA